MRLNIGSGYFQIEGDDWMNLDSDPDVGADITADAKDYLSTCDDGGIDEIYAGHFLEHLTQAGALAFLAECYRVLVPGGNLGIVVPDTREVMRRYVVGAVDQVEYPLNVWRPIKDIDTINAIFIYSTVQPSPHRWMWDQETLARAMMGAGFTGLRDIDRYRDTRLGTGQWYQMGFDGWKPEVTR